MPGFVRDKSYTWLMAVAPPQISRFTRVSLYRLGWAVTRKKKKKKAHKAFCPSRKSLGDGSHRQLHARLGSDMSLALTNHGPEQVIQSRPAPKGKWRQTSQITAWWVREVGESHRRSPRRLRSMPYLSLFFVILQTCHHH